MREIAISDVKTGMKLSRDVQLPDGRILLLKGFVIKPRYIRKLELFNISSIYIEEDKEVPYQNISEEKVYSEAFCTMKSVLSSIREGKNLDVKLTRDAVDSIVQKVINNESVFMQLTGIRDIDNYTFLHSVDVCIYSLIAGKALGLTTDELLDLGIGAILHDIGKCRVPLEILTKPGKLTNEEFYFMKLHTIYGYEIISNTPGLDKNIANIACQHHERWNGEGYPLRLKEHQIEMFARIICVADVYDALTADRVYKKRDMPHTAAEYILNQSSIIFDPDIADVFIKNVAIYPMNTVVLLNTGEVGYVVESAKPPSMRPKVRVIAQKDGPPILKPYIVDLADNLEISVVDILS